MCHYSLLARGSTSFQEWRMITIPKEQFTIVTLGEWYAPRIRCTTLGTFVASPTFSPTPELLRAGHSTVKQHGEARNEKLSHRYPYLAFFEILLA
jgi:hypothetical protein